MNLTNLEYMITELFLGSEIIGCTVQFNNSELSKPFLPLCLFLSARGNRQSDHGLLDASALLPLETARVPA